MTETNSEFKTLNNIKKVKISDLTTEEFTDILSQTKKRWLLYGIAGIQELLQCSESKAKRVKKSGVINDAIIQNGRKIIVDADKALELLKNAKIGR